MTLGVILLNFGEPEEATEAEVVPYLERIFSMNRALEGDAPDEQAQARSRELARRRAPGLIEEYRRIGGSPLHRQALAQARALGQELAKRGRRAHTYSGMQFTAPTIGDAVERAQADGVELLISLPVYPLCGTSTTVAALQTVREEVERRGWNVPVQEVSGWHRHPAYTAMRADGIRQLARETGLDLQGGGTQLVFSAHGIPLKYIQAGNRYDLYVEDSCRRIAEAAGVREYRIGYQNHTNRPVEWTQPDIDEVMAAVAGTAEAVVVVPVSFMHEQSETLAELDMELREAAEARGLRFARVPVPHDDPRFAGVLADLVDLLAGEEVRTRVEWQPCRCRATAQTFCTNADLPRAG